MAREALAPCRKTHRPFSSKAQTLARDGMVELLLKRVEHEPTLVTGTTVELVAHDGVAGVRKVHTNLMATARSQLDKHERARAVAGEKLNVRGRRLSLAGHADAHATGVVAIAADGGVKGSRACGKRAAHLRKVAFVQVMPSNKGVEGWLELLGQREEHETGRGDVQALDGLRVRAHTTLGKRRADGIGERRRTGSVTMHELPRRLVGGEKNRVMVDNARSGNVRSGRRNSRLSEAYAHRITGLQLG